MSHQASRRGKDEEAAASGPFQVGKGDGAVPGSVDLSYCPTVLSALKTTFSQLEAAWKNVAFGIISRIELPVGMYRLYGLEQVT